MDSLQWTVKKKYLLTVYCPLFAIFCPLSTGLMKVKSYSISDRGRVRNRNEDAYLADDKARLYIVADGMGGHVGGDLASRMAVECIREVVLEYDRAHRSKENSKYGMEAELKLTDALKQANDQIFHESSDRPEYRGMGTTTTSILVQDDTATIAHVGDSRAYLMRDGEIRQITEDHSWVNEQVKAGFITSEEARTHRLKNVITRSLGHEPDVMVDIVRLDLKEDDSYLICTDGLSNMVTDAEIREAVAGHEPDEALKTLVDLANERGGYDNITAVLIKVLLN